ncbi:helix-turn-helix domain-containing protein [Saccharomonospora piscinae]|uniref:helix-turn-helix domain-containing protein n=1 Tax=Saccharomonospora piscinae TaxID=687388 RepID=UPI003CCA581E
MGRPERPVDPDAGPVQRFAWELRRLREDAGSPTYRQLARRAHYSATTLSEAAGARHCPRWPWHSPMPTPAAETAASGNNAGGRRCGRSTSHSSTPAPKAPPWRPPDEPLLLTAPRRDCRGRSRRRW